MFKRLGIAIAIPISILGYAYLCKYFYSLIDFQIPSLGQLIAGFALFGFFLIPFSLCLVVIEGIIQLFGKNEDTDYTESLKELDELFPGIQRSDI